MSSHPPKRATAANGTGLLRIFRQSVQQIRHYKSSSSLKLSEKKSALIKDETANDKENGKIESSFKREELNLDASKKVSNSVIPQNKTVPKADVIPKKKGAHKSSSSMTSQQAVGTYQRVSTFVEKFDKMNENATCSKTSKYEENGNLQSQRLSKSSLEKVKKNSKIKSNISTINSIQKNELINKDIGDKRIIERCEDTVEVTESKSFLGDESPVLCRNKNMQQIKENTLHSVNTCGRSTEFACTRPLSSTPKKSCTKIAEKIALDEILNDGYWLEEVGSNSQRESLNELVHADELKDVINAEDVCQKQKKLLGAKDKISKPCNQDSHSTTKRKEAKHHVGNPHHKYHANSAKHLISEKQYEAGNTQSKERQNPKYNSMTCVRSPERIQKKEQAHILEGSSSQWKKSHRQSNADDATVQRAPRHAIMNKPRKRSSKRRRSVNSSSSSASSHRNVGRNVAQTRKQHSPHVADQSRVNQQQNQTVADSTTIDKALQFCSLEESSVLMRSEHDANMGTVNIDSSLTQHVNEMNINCAVSRKAEQDDFSLTYLPPPPPVEIMEEETCLEEEVVGDSNQLITDYLPPMPDELFSMSDSADTNNIVDTNTETTVAGMNVNLDHLSKTNKDNRLDYAVITQISVLTSNELNNKLKAEENDFVDSGHDVFVSEEGRKSNCADVCVDFDSKSQQETASEQEVPTEEQLDEVKPPLSWNDYIPPPPDETEIFFKANSTDPDIISETSFSDARFNSLQDIFVLSQEKSLSLSFDDPVLIDKETLTDEGDTIFFYKDSGEEMKAISAGMLQVERMQDCKNSPKFINTVKTASETRATFSSSDPKHEENENKACSYLANETEYQTEPREYIDEMTTAQQMPYLDSYWRYCFEQYDNMWYENNRFLNNEQRMMYLNPYAAYSEWGMNDQECSPEGMMAYYPSFQGSGYNQLAAATSESNGIDQAVYSNINIEQSLKMKDVPKCSQIAEEATYQKTTEADKALCFGKFYELSLEKSDVGGSQQLNSMYGQKSEMTNQEVSMADADCCTTVPDAYFPSNLGLMTEVNVQKEHAVRPVDITTMNIYDDGMQQADNCNNNMAEPLITEPASNDFKHNNDLNTGASAELDHQSTAGLKQDSSVPLESDCEDRKTTESSYREFNSWSDETLLGKVNDGNVRKCSTCLEPISYIVWKMCKCPKAQVQIFNGTLRTCANQSADLGYLSHDSIDVTDGSNPMSSVFPTTSTPAAPEKGKLATPSSSQDTLFARMQMEQPSFNIPRSDVQSLEQGISTINEKMHNRITISPSSQSSYLQNGNVGSLATDIAVNNNAFGSDTKKEQMDCEEQPNVNKNVSALHDTNNNTLKKAKNVSHLWNEGLHTPKAFSDLGEMETCNKLMVQKLSKNDQAIESKSSDTKANHESINNIKIVKSFVDTSKEVDDEAMGMKGQSSVNYVQPVTFIKDRKRLRNSDDSDDEASVELDNWSKGNQDSSLQKCSEVSQTDLSPFFDCIDRQQCKKQAALSNIKVPVHATPDYHRKNLPIMEEVPDKSIMLEFNCKPDSGINQGLHSCSKQKLSYKTHSDTLHDYARFQQEFTDCSVPVTSSYSDISLQSSGMPGHRLDDASNITFVNGGDTKATPIDPFKKRGRLLGIKLVDYEVSDTDDDISADKDQQHKKQLDVHEGKELPHGMLKNSGIKSDLKTVFWNRANAELKKLSPAMDQENHHGIKRKFQNIQTSPCQEKVTNLSLGTPKITEAAFRGKLIENVTLKDNAMKANLEKMFSKNISKIDSPRSLESQSSETSPFPGLVANQNQLPFSPISPFPNSPFWGMYLGTYNSPAASPSVLDQQSPMPLLRRSQSPWMPQSFAWQQKMSAELRPSITSNPLERMTGRTMYSSPTFDTHSQSPSVVTEWRKDFNRFHSFGVKYIDTHCHLDFLFSRAGFKGNLKDYMEKHPETFPSTFEGCVAVFCNPASFTPKGGLWQEVAKEDNVWIAMGCHPKNATDFTGAAESGLKQCLQHRKCVALGEIGLDYSGRFRQHEETQKKVFRCQLKMAVAMQKPLVIHCRDSSYTRDAEQDCLQILKELVPRDYKIHCHCFTSHFDHARLWLDTFPNLYIGMTPLVTYRSASPSHNLAKRIPLDRLLLETDAPYFIPRCIPREDMHLSNPGVAITVAKEVAHLQDVPVSTVLKQCRINTKAMYGI